MTSKYQRKSTVYSEKGILAEVCRYFNLKFHNDRIKYVFMGLFPKDSNPLVPHNVEGNHLFIFKQVFKRKGTIRLTYFETGDIKSLEPLIC